MKIKFKTIEKLKIGDLVQLGTDIHPLDDSDIERCGIKLNVSYRVAGFMSDYNKAVIYLEGCATAFCQTSFVKVI